MQDEVHYGNKWGGKADGAAKPSDHVIKVIRLLPFHSRLDNNMDRKRNPCAILRNRVLSAESTKTYIEPTKVLVKTHDIVYPLIHVQSEKRSKLLSPVRRGGVRCHLRIWWARLRS